MEMEAHQERRVQFNLRSMMYATTLLAFVCAVFAPFLRGFDTEQQLALMVVGLIEILCFVTGMVVTKLRRERTLLRAGKREFRTSFYERRQTSFKREALVALKLLAIAAVQIGIGVYLYVIVRAEVLAPISRDNMEILLMLLMQLAFLSQVAPTLVWSMIWGIDDQDIEIAEHGMIRHGVRFIPWREIQDARASQFFDDAIVLVFGFVAKNMSGKTTKTAVVPQEHRDGLVSRIADKIKMDQASSPG